MNLKQKNDLLEVDREFAETSTQKGAAEAFNEFLSENALQLPNGQNPIIGRNAIYEGMKNSPLTYSLEWIPQDGEVSEFGDLGFTWGIYTFAWQDENGKRNESKGKYLNVWKKINNEWKVIVDMGNQNPEEKK